LTAASSVNATLNAISSSCSTALRPTVGAAIGSCSSSAAALSSTVLITSASRRRQRTTRRHARRSGFSGPRRKHVARSATLTPCAASHTFVSGPSSSPSAAPVRIARTALLGLCAGAPVAAACCFFSTQRQEPCSDIVG